MATKVIARTIPLTAVQNHSEPGPMNDIPSVLMNVTPMPSVLLPRCADDTRGVALTFGRSGRLSKGRAAHDRDLVSRPVRRMRWAVGFGPVVSERAELLVHATRVNDGALVAF
jgi:hypothetical protein